MDLGSGGGSPPGGSSTTGCENDGALFTKVVWVDLIRPSAGGTTAWYHHGLDALVVPCHLGAHCDRLHALFSLVRLECPDS